MNFTRMTLIRITFDDRHSEWEYSEEWQYEGIIKSENGNTTFTRMTFIRITLIWWVLRTAILSRIKI